eukprot:TRINITY_DN9753_c3_g2_i1.p1 TRINITY_DN9753_c3_g2~~TRINITY_DN9753_c3_g2_i1.p1  ORF type:complete len:668 (+),score=163.73 TRINITY_DN9753_c3_g2_i1:114-2117(+)
MTNSSGGRPLKILQLKPGTSEVDILDENLDLVRENLFESGASLVSIVSVMGMYRSGKSFLLDLMLRYMRTRAAVEKAIQKEVAEEERARREAAMNEPAFKDCTNCGTKLASSAKFCASCGTQTASSSQLPESSMLNEEKRNAERELRIHGAPNTAWRYGEDSTSSHPLPPWFLQSNAERIAEGTEGEEHTGFKYRGGKEKCTEGIWVWSEPFVFTGKDGREIAVLLMDTQGAWDNTMSQAQSATIFGLTALLSSKLVYNVQNAVNEIVFQNLDYITTFAQTVCQQLPHKDTPFGALHLLVRDWTCYDEGWTLDRCREDMEEHRETHLSVDKVPVDARARVERMGELFKSVHIWGLPHPGLAITKSKWQGNIENIERDFIQLLDGFMKDFFGDGFPRASAPLGCEITVDGFKTIVHNFARTFQDNAEGMALGLRDAFVNVQLITCRDQLLKDFGMRLNKFAPDSSVVDPVKLKHQTDLMCHDFTEEFMDKLRGWKLPQAEVDDTLNNFKESIGTQVKWRTMQNQQHIEGANMKIMLSPVVGGGTYFMFCHHWLLYGFTVVGGVMHFRKCSMEHNTEITDPVVLQSVAADIKKFGLQRWMDVQAIQVAAQRFNPNDAMDQFSKTTKQMGALAATAAAAANNAPGNNNSNSLTQPLLANEHKPTFSGPAR